MLIDNKSTGQGRQEYLASYRVFADPEFSGEISTVAGVGNGVTNKYIGTHYANLSKGVIRGDHSMHFRHMTLLSNMVMCLITAQYRRPPFD